MQPVKPPEHGEGDPKRPGECRDALESKVQQLLEEAYRAGWTREEAVAALLDIAQRPASGGTFP